MFNNDIKEIIKEVIEICVNEEEKYAEFRLNGRWYSITIIDNLADNNVEVILYDDLHDTTVCRYISNWGTLIVKNIPENVTFKIDHFLQIATEYVADMSINDNGLEIDAYNDDMAI